MFISLVDTKSKTHISVQVDVSCGSFAALKQHGSIEHQQGKIGYGVRLVLKAKLK